MGGPYPLPEPYLEGCILEPGFRSPWPICGDQSCPLGVGPRPNGPPQCPPPLDLIWSVSLVDLLVLLLILPVNLLIVWDWIACELITLFVIFFHAIILHDYRFFFEVPSFEESRDPNSSPRREEVGRRTLRDYGGFLLSFFYRDRFRYIQTLWE